jgi:chitinase
VTLKKQNPYLKVMLALGGWGGCETCSDVFSTEKDIKEFANSVKSLNDYFKTDGIDLDWEYPAIEGYPGHKYKPADKKNFTALVKQLRETLGEKQEISFAAGGFKKFLDEAIEWEPVMKIVDRVNLMSYDLVHGFSTETGHHTPLYSTPEQLESTNNAVSNLIKMGVPPNKIVIGAAFYGRMWENVPAEKNGLYQKGKFKSSIAFKDFDSTFSAQKGFVYHWDSTASAPFLYNAREKLFVTFDDEKSLRLKTNYVVTNKLQGIMFWHLGQDKKTNGLLDVIDKAATRTQPKKTVSPPN